MGNDLREWLVPDDTGDASPDAVAERRDSALSDLIAANAGYRVGDDSDDSEMDVPLPEDKPTGHGNHRSEDASAAASQEPTAAASVTDSQGIQIGDGNIQINISFEIFDRLERDAPPAAALAWLLASLAPEPVPLDLLLDALNAAWRPGAEAARTLGLLPGDPAAIRNATAELRMHTLAVQTDNGQVQMPGPARDRTRARLTSTEQAGSWRHVAADLVGAAIATAGQLPDARSDWTALLPHARAVLDLTSHGIWQLALSLAHPGSYAKARDLCALIVDAYRDSGDYGPGYMAARSKLARWTMLAANED
jgi:hypothetical protein